MTKTLRNRLSNNINLSNTVSKPASGIKKFSSGGVISSDDLNKNFEYVIGTLQSASDFLTNVSASLDKTLTVSQLVRSDIQSLNLIERTPLVELITITKGGTTLENGAESDTFTFAGSIQIVGAGINSGTMDILEFAIHTDASYTGDVFADPVHGTIASTGLGATNLNFFYILKDFDDYQTYTIYATPAYGEVLTSEIQKVVLNGLKVYNTNIETPENISITYTGIEENGVITTEWYTERVSNITDTYKPIDNISFSKEVILQVVEEAIEAQIGDVLDQLAEARLINDLSGETRVYSSDAISTTEPGSNYIELTRTHLDLNDNKITSMEDGVEATDGITVGQFEYLSNEIDDLYVKKVTNIEIPSGGTVETPIISVDNELDSQEAQTILKHKGEVSIDGVLTDELHIGPTEDLEGNSGIKITKITDELGNISSKTELLNGGDGYDVVVDNIGDDIYKQSVKFGDFTMGVGLDDIHHALIENDTREQADLVDGSIITKRLMDEFGDGIIDNALGPIQEEAELIAANTAANTKVLETAGKYISTLNSDRFAITNSISNITIPLFAANVALDNTYTNIDFSNGIFTVTEEIPNQVFVFSLLFGKFIVPNMVLRVYSVSGNVSTLIESIPVTKRLPGDIGWTYTTTLDLMPSSYRFELYIPQFTGRDTLESTYLRVYGLNLSATEGIAMSSQIIYDGDEKPEDNLNIPITRVYPYFWRDELADKTYMSITKNGTENYVDGDGLFIQKNVSIGLDPTNPDHAVRKEWYEAQTSELDQELAEIIEQIYID